MIERGSFLPEQGGLTLSQYHVGQPIVMLSLESKRKGKNGFFHVVGSET